MPKGVTTMVVSLAAANSVADFVDLGAGLYNSFLQPQNAKNRIAVIAVNAATRGLL